jgi:cytochrome b
MLQSIKVWDMPTRVFHWLLAFSFAAAFITAESERWLLWHLIFGYTVGGLIAFRWWCGGLLAHAGRALAVFCLHPVKPLIMPCHWWVKAQINIMSVIIL